MNSSKQKLIIKNLSKSFQDSKLKVLDDISLTVEKGELVSIIGPSGCGKSTLLDCIAGVTEYDSGEIQSKGGAAYMFQDDVMFPWRSIIDNVILPLELSGMKKDQARNEAEGYLKDFGLETFATYYPFMLSGGMRERAALLRTYLCKKEVLLLDEPFSKLDALTRLKMQLWFLKTLQKQKKAVLFVTHDIDEAIFLSDKIYIVSKRPAKLIAEIQVPIKKPRSADILTSSTFITVKKQIMKKLTSVQQ